YSFRVFHSDPDNPSGLGSNFIRALCVDKNGKIWVGTEQGIFIFNPDLEGSLYSAISLLMKFSLFRNAWMGTSGLLITFNSTNTVFTRKKSCWLFRTVVLIAVRFD